MMIVDFHINTFQCIVKKMWIDLLGEQPQFHLEILPFILFDLPELLLDCLIHGIDGAA
jgi:hypothetical protein